jgi:hypothetical protein
MIQNTSRSRRQQRRIPAALLRGELVFARPTLWSVEAGPRGTWPLPYDTPFPAPLRRHAEWRHALVTFV